ncbi:MAG: nitronate monooxygenase [Armatimonadota bacterium]
MEATQSNRPMIIQAGMGVAVSDWKLARSVASRGYMGVVSGTALDLVLTRRLQIGDPEGILKEAFDAFPIQEIANKVWSKYFIEGGKEPGKPFKSKPVYTVKPSQAVLELTVLANFVEVYLAKHGHDGVVGINLLEKIQLPTVPSLFGAMLAGVDYVLMGAGIPRQIPAILDRLSALEPADLKIDVAGAIAGDDFTTSFDPKKLGDFGVTHLKRPQFLAIISSNALATTLVRKCSPPVDGFVIEGSRAGGHNAPPRGGIQLDDQGEPIYGPKDEPDLAAIKELGKPFWLAGSWGSADRLQEALELGAEGIQVGTAFAFCNESGIDPILKQKVIQKSRDKDVNVVTDIAASPTGFPFKVVGVEGTLSDPDIANGRERICDLGYLRQLYKKEDGSVGYRCPGEPIEDYLAKGGLEIDTVNRRCICNALASTIGLGQTRNGRLEPAIVTAGNDVENIGQFLKEGEVSYSADEVLERLALSAHPKI